MQDRELVAAIVNGDPDGLGEAYDRYAASLYAYCRSMLPDPHPPGEAADAVADTFTIAAAKLEGLRDPDQLGSWLHAVARNECLRAARGREPAAGDAPGWPRPMPPGWPRRARCREVSPPGALRERVLQAGADNTPTGRADRVSVTHRAGAFGRTGFPKPIIPPGPRWWHEVRRHPRAAAGVAAVAVAVVAGGIAVLLIAGGTHRARASTVALGGGNFGTSAAPRRGLEPGGRAILAEPQVHARIGIAEHGDVPDGRAHGGPEHVAGRAAVIRADPVLTAAVAVPVTVALAVAVALALALAVASADPGHPAGDAERAGAVRGQGQAGQRDVHRDRGGRPGQLRRH